MPTEGKIFAVIWCDFIPLSLQEETAEVAIRKATEMRERIKARGAFMDVRAVSLDLETDTITDLIPREVKP